jgi:hypothetical protein
MMECDHKQISAPGTAGRLRCGLRRVTGISSPLQPKGVHPAPTSGLPAANGILAPRLPRIGGPPGRPSRRLPTDPSGGRSPLHHLRRWWTTDIAGKSHARPPGACPAKFVPCIRMERPLLLSPGRIIPCVAVPQRPHRTQRRLSKRRLGDVRESRPRVEVALNVKAPKKNEPSERTSHHRCT